MFRGNKAKLFTQDQLLGAMEGNNDLEASALLTELSGVPITRQNVYYWRKQMEAGGNGKVNKFNKAAADRGLVKERKLRAPDPKDYAGDVAIDDKEYKRILVMPDLHAPYHHKDALKFMESVKNNIRPDLVVNLGDEVDNHAISFHNSDPNLLSAADELVAARRTMNELHRIFPNMLICHSNHGSLHFRRAKAHGIPVEYLRTYREILFPDGGGAGWAWNYQHTVHTPLGDVAFKHQCPAPAVNAAAHEGANIVVGHAHSNFEVSYKASRQRLYWGATAGCLIDRSALAFAYGKESPNKPMLGCMVILNGAPHLVPMVLDEDGNWEGA